MIYEIELSEIENLAFSAVAANPHDWITNAAKERCRIAIDDIVNITVQKCLQNGVTIPSTKEQIIQLAFDYEWVKPLSSNT